MSKGRRSGRLKSRIRRPCGIQSRRNTRSRGPGPRQSGDRGRSTARRPAPVGRGGALRSLADASRLRPGRPRSGRGRRPRRPRRRRGSRGPGLAARSESMVERSEGRWRERSRRCGTRWAERLAGAAPRLPGEGGSRERPTAPGRESRRPGVRVGIQGSSVGPVCGDRAVPGCVRKKRWELQPAHLPVARRGPLVWRGPRARPGTDWGEGEDPQVGLESDLGL